MTDRCRYMIKHTQILTQSCVYLQGITGQAHGRSLYAMCLTAVRVRQIGSIFGNFHLMAHDGALTSPSQARPIASCATFQVE
jgi:hypothetical protein